MNENLVQSGRDYQLSLKEAYFTTEPPLKVPNQRVSSLDTNYNFHHNPNLLKRLKPLMAFKIYEDPKNYYPLLSDTNGLQNTMIRNKREKSKHIVTAKNDVKRVNKHRFVSDTVLNNRVVSSDNELIFTRKNNSITSSEFPINQLILPYNSNKLRGHKRVPLVRKMFSEISPLTEGKRSYSYHTIDLRKKLASETQRNDDTEGIAGHNIEATMIQDTENTHNNINDDDNKENLTSCLIYDYSLIKELSDNTNSSLASKEGQKQRDNSDGLIHLFTPEYFWNHILSNKERGSTISLEDFHLLLYDYEQLWNLFVLNERRE